MLTTLTIRDFVIVDTLELEFGRGLTVLTGETGAGKSIVVDAIGLLLGDRGDAGVVRPGQEKAELTVEFDLSRLADARDFLRDNDLDEDGECIVHRRIGTDGRSRATVNGRPVPLRALKELGESLIEIHGQQAHQALTEKTHQRALLDQFAHSESLASIVAEAYSAWRETRKQLKALDETADPEKLEYLRHQVRELEALALKDGELDELDAEHRRLANAEKLISAAGQALELVAGEDAVSDVLARAQTQLEAAAQSDPGLKDSAGMFADAVIQLQEAGQNLRHYIDAMEANPSALDRTERRLNEIHDLARKHRVKPAELPDRLKELHQQVNQQGNVDERRASLERVLEGHQQDWQRKARTLSKSRQQAAKVLNDRVTDLMASLGMPDGRFEVRVETTDTEEPAPNGMDEIEFLVSANAGQPPGPLKKVASGGELSRIGLAIKVVNISDDVPLSLVFDEVDAGIGGNTADTVGTRLRELGQRHQVVCVTHLAQVAAKGHQHFAVSKQTENDKTLARVEPLGAVERVQEIARMLGGGESASSIDHAKALLKGN